MDQSNSNPATTEQPTTAGKDNSSTEATPLHKEPVKSITSAGRGGAAAGGGLTLNVKCTVTLRNGLTRFGGPKASGSDFGHGDNGNSDVVLELEGNATLDGGAAAVMFGEPEPRKLLQPTAPPSHEPSPGEGNS